MTQLIQWEDFAKIDIRSGTIIAAKINEKAKIPACILIINSLQKVKYFRALVICFCFLS